MKVRTNCQSLNLPKQLFDLPVQFRQVGVNGFPYHFQVNSEVAMCNAIAHGVDHYPGDFGMRGGKCGVIALDVVCRFPDDFKIANYGILRFLVVQKGDFVCVGQIAVDALYRFDNMSKVSGMRSTSALLIR